MLYKGKQRNENVTLEKHAPGPPLPLLQELLLLEQQVHLLTKMVLELVLAPDNSPPLKKTRGGHCESPFAPVDTCSSGEANDYTTR